MRYTIVMKTLLASAILALLIPLSAHAARVTVTPARVLQGDPIMITLTGARISAVQSATVSGSKVYFSLYKSIPTALYGVDINQKIGTTTVRVVFTDGSLATTSFVILPRVKPQEYLPVPQQLGGNSTANQAKIVSLLQTENANLATLTSRAKTALWTASTTSTFVFPIASSTKNPLTVTDTYGYNRQSGAQTITHKGVDFHATSGTPVYAISGGVIRANKTYVMYGNTIILDHGLGLLSMYMHLSKSLVTSGQTIKKGQLIGYSGETGYSEGPHLHLTIRLGGISIDPMKFFALFGTKL